MENKELYPVLESILFASGEPISTARLCEILEADSETLTFILSIMEEKYKDETRGIRLLRLDDKYQLCTKEEYSDYVKKALDHRRNVTLSQAALEVLSIIAYNQPVTRGYIEQIRGVECSAVINNLVEKELVEEKGRLDAPGKPLLFGTTSAFLRVFNISSILELPNLPDLPATQEIPLTEV